MASFHATALVGLSLVVPGVLSAAASCPTTADPGPGVDSVFVNRTDGSVWPFLQYKTESFNPPWLNITANGEALSPGYLFIAPSGSTSATKQFGPVMMTDKGDLVWNGPVVSGEASESASLTAINNFRTQKINGTDYITFWEGTNTNGANIGHGYGATYFVDTSYNTKYTVCPKLGLVADPQYNITCQGDLHEQYVTPQGTLLTTAYNITPYDLTPVGGPKNGYLYDSQVYELDIPSGEILFRWSSIEHANITSSKLPLGTSGNFSAPWDWFHINSIQSVPEYGAYLINSRHLWTTYLVHTTNGSVIWEFEGFSGGDFGAPPADATFSWEHFVRIHNATATGFSISYFNNDNNGMLPPALVNQTKGLEFQLSLPPSKSKTPVVSERLVVAGEPIYVDSQGSYLFLPSDTDVQTQFMMYGQIPVMREYGLATDGSDLRWEARFGVDTDTQSYRGFKDGWTALPGATAPKLVVERGTAHGCANATGYVSWNGATNVTGWAVYEGAASGSLKQSGVVPFRGFETAFTPNATNKCVQVAAVQGGKQIKKSNLVCS